MKKSNKLNKKERKNCTLATKISKIKKDNPSWGYRRVWACLKKNNKTNVSSKAVYRVMKESSLLCHKASCLEQFLQGKKEMTFYVTVSTNVKNAG
jgi:HTH-like domain